MPLNVGVLLQNRYRIEDLLGKGGMGAVYRAIDLTFNAPVAIKENLEVGIDAQKQFAHEANLLHQLRHPNIPRVTDYFFVPYQGQYLVMDYVEGESLKQILSRFGLLSQQQALICVLQVLNALMYLHRNEIIHRDVKPANVKLTPDGAVFLLGFGLVKVYDPSQETTSGARAVTPGFAPAEQYGTARTDARSDVYFVGATLYALLTGESLPDAVDLVTGSEKLSPPYKFNPEVSPAVEAAILRAMQPRADARFPTADVFWDTLADEYYGVEHPSADTATLRDIARPALEPLLVVAREVEERRTTTQPDSSVTAPVSSMASVRPISHATHRALYLPLGHAVSYAVRTKPVANARA